MSLTKLSLGGKKLNFSRPGRVWSVTSRLGTGKRPTLFYSVFSYVFESIRRRNSNAHLLSARGLQRDVVCLDRPITPSYEPKCGGRDGWGGCGRGVSANEYSCAHGTKINFGDLTLYLTYGRRWMKNVLRHTARMLKEFLWMLIYHENMTDKKEEKRLTESTGR